MSGQPNVTGASSSRTTDGDDPRSAEELLPLVYTELRRLAKSRLAKVPPGQTLQPTALVHEAYLRLVRTQGLTWEGRPHFFAAAAQAMRDILVEHARRKATLKRGGNWKRAAVDTALASRRMQPADLLAVDEVVKRLEALSPRRGCLVNMRYFAGLSTEDTAVALGLSAASVRREWRFIKRWLFVQLTDQQNVNRRRNDD